MPWTNYPNGVSVTTAIGAVAGQFNATTVIVPSGGLSGETVAITVEGTSAARTHYIPVPFAGEVISCIVTNEVAGSSALSYTITQGSAGTEISAASTGAFAVIGGIRNNVVTSVALTTADSIEFVSVNAATIAKNSCTVVLARA